jgi:predicted ATPase
MQPAPKSESGRIVRPILDAGSHTLTLEPDLVSAENLERDDLHPEHGCARIEQFDMSAVDADTGEGNRSSVAEVLPSKPTCGISISQSASVSRKRQQFLSMSRAPILIPGRHAEVVSLRRVLDAAKNTGKRELDSNSKFVGPDRPCSFPSTTTNLYEHSPVQFVLIQGKRGVGKTCLARTLRPMVEADGGYFVETRFDPRRAFIPFSALVSVILDWVRLVLARGPAAVTDARSLLLSNLDQDDIEMILKAMPCLSLIILEPKGLSDESFGSTLSSSERSGSRSKSSSEDEWRRQLNCSYAVVERFPFVFGTIMRCIGSPEKPVVVMYDDFQHADTDSIMLLKRTAIDAVRGGIVFVAVVQTTGSDQRTNPHTIGAVSVHNDFSQNALCTVVSLTDLDFIDTKHFVSELVLPGESQAGDEAQHALAVCVHERTKGNISQIWEVLEDLERAVGGPRLHETNGESLPTAVKDAARFQVFGRSLDQEVPNGFDDLLRVSACLGCTVDIEVIRCALPHQDMTPLLQRAIDEGAFYLPQGSSLTGSDGSVAMWYGFLDDRMPGAIREQLPENELMSVHVKLGRRLWRQLSEQDIHLYAFHILSQLMFGQGKISREKERIAVATLCLHAGRVAAKMSSFRVALSYFAFGLGRLETVEWRNQYDLLLALTNSAAEMSLCTGQYDQMDEYLENVFEYGRTFQDKVQAYGTRISSFSIRDRQKDALNLGIEVLHSLGEKVPRNFQIVFLLQAVSRSRRLLRGKSDRQLLRLPPLTNETKLLALQILHLLMMSAIMQEPRTAPFFVFSMLRITIEHGLCGIGCFSFSAYGMILISLFRNYKDATRYSNVSISLAERGIEVEFMPRMYAAHYGTVAQFSEPLSNCLLPTLKGHRIALYTGDTEVASLCAVNYVFLAFELDVPLREVHRSWRCFREHILLTKQESLLRAYSPALQIVSHLIGLTDDPLGAAGDLIDYDEFLRQALIEKRQDLASEVGYSRMYLAFIFNEYPLAGSFASLISLPNTRPAFVYVAYCFRVGLVAAAMAREKTERRKNIRAATKAIRLLERFATVGPQNCLVRLSLLRAELASALGKTEDAYREYITAISTAPASRSLSMRALSNECFARHLLRLGSSKKAEPYFLEALSVYEEWGACAKVKQLSRFVESIYGDSRQGELTDTPSFDRRPI